MPPGFTLHQQRAMMQQYWRDAAIYCAECGASMIVHPIAVPGKPTDLVSASCPQCGRAFQGHGPTGGSAPWPDGFVQALLAGARAGQPAPRCPNDDARLQVRRVDSAHGTLVLLRCQNCGQRTGGPVTADMPIRQQVG